MMRGVPAWVAGCLGVLAKAWGSMGALACRVRKQVCACPNGSDGQPLVRNRAGRGAGQSRCWTREAWACRPRRDAARGLTCVVLVRHGLLDGGACPNGRPSLPSRRAVRAARRCVARGSLGKSFEHLVAGCGFCLGRGVLGANVGAGVDVRSLSKARAASFR